MTASQIQRLVDKAVKREIRKLSTTIGALDHGSLLGLSDDDHSQYMLDPGTVTDNALSRWDGTTGRLLQNSGWLLLDTNQLTAGGVLSMGLNDIAFGSLTLSRLDGTDTTIDFKPAGISIMTATTTDLQLNVGIDMTGGDISQIGDLYGAFSGASPIGVQSDFDMNSNDITDLANLEVASINNGGSSVGFADDVDLNDNNLDDVASIDGGGNAVLFGDDIDLDGNDLILGADGGLILHEPSDALLEILFGGTLAAGDLWFSPNQIETASLNTNGINLGLTIITGADTAGVFRNSGTLTLRTGDCNNNAGDIILRPGEGASNGQIEFRAADNTLVFQISNANTFEGNAPMNLNNNPVREISDIEINNGIALGGGSTATLGTIGGSGPATAAQNQWLQIEISGSTYFVPVWA